MTVSLPSQAKPLSPWSGVALYSWRLLTFRMSGNGFTLLSWRHLLAGLLGTWIVGMGRYWDDDHAVLLQKLGVGSVVYVFVLAAVLYWFIRPLGPTRWRYFDVLTFITLTSFPAVFYAIPVERFMSADHAANANLVLLGIIAAWRVALLVLFVRRYGELSWVRTTLGVGTPLISAVTVVMFLGVMARTIATMGGVRSREDQLIADLTCPTALVALVLFLAYLLVVARASLNESLRGGG